MSISLSKKDIYWSYLAQFFSLASGIIILPMVLRMLSTAEIGMNYLMLTIGSLVALFDFGFAPQFGRNITYVLSGAKELKKEGVDIFLGEAVIDYKLLTTMISTAKVVYCVLSVIVLVLMLGLGTVYIYYITNGFHNVKNSFLIWIVYSFSTFFNIYYLYYDSLLTGKGLIMESKKAMIFSKVTYILLAFVFLKLGWGLLGLSIANLISPFIQRFISYYYFFTSELKAQLSQYRIDWSEKVYLFKIIWHNSKKLGLVFIGSYTINKLSIFIAGLFLSLGDIASYGLMVQFVNLILIISSTLFIAFNPLFASLRVKQDNNKLIRVFAFTMNIYYLLFFVGTLFLIYFVPWLLVQIDSNTQLPPNYIVVLFCIVMMLEGNHSSFATMITTKNEVPFVKPSLIAGAAIAIGDYVVLAYSSFGILGLVLVQGVVQIVYANWKWPYEVCKEFKINVLSFILMGIKETTIKVRNII